MAKQQLEKATNGSAGAEVEAREAPIIKSGALSWQSEGYSWREAFVRLPAGMIFQDLQDVPTIWKNVQATRQTALQRFDRVTCVSFDESWLVKDVLVADAGPQHVVLAIRPGDLIRLTSKSAEFQDERHRIRWAGSGFAVFRRSDDIQMIPTYFANIDAAKSEMYRLLYPVAAKQP